MSEEEIEMKQWIDNATIEDLLMKVKNEPEDSSWFMLDSIGNYLLDKIDEIKEKHYSAYNKACLVVWGKKNMTIEEMKAWVDNASIEDLLKKFITESTDSPWFVSEPLNNYLMAQINKAKKETPDEYKKARKSIWG